MSVIGCRMSRDRRCLQPPAGRTTRAVALTDRRLFRSESAPFSADKGADRKSVRRDTAAANQARSFGWEEEQGGSEGTGVIDPPLGDHPPRSGCENRDPYPIFNHQCVVGFDVNHFKSASQLLGDLLGGRQSVFTEVAVGAGVEIHRQTIQVPCDVIRSTMR